MLWRLGLGILLVVGCASEVTSSGDDAGGTPAADTGAADTGGGTTGGPATGGLTVTVADGRLVELGWAAVEGAHVRLVIAQGSVEVAIPAKAGASTVTIPGDIGEESLLELTAGEADWRVETASSSAFEDASTAAQGKTTLMDRYVLFFDNQIPKPIAIDGLPLQAAVGTKLSLKFNTGSAGARGRIFISRPDESVDLVEVDGGGALAPGQDISFEYELTAAGTYVFELLSSDFLPAAVEPVYVGDFVPLLVPEMEKGDFAQFSAPLDIDALREEMLGWINDVRGRVGAAPLVQHPLANQTSHTKADLLAEKLVVAHSTADGSIPKAKAMAAGVGLAGSISENLALEYALKRAYWGLYHSPSHRWAWLSGVFASCGLGVAMWSDGSGRAIVVQHLSSQVP